MKRKLIPIIDTLNELIPKLIWVRDFLVKIAYPNRLDHTDLDLHSGGQDNFPEVNN